MNVRDKSLKAIQSLVVYKNLLLIKVYFPLFLIGNDFIFSIYIFFIRLITSAINYRFTDGC